ncbi:hypothetical protein FOMG_17705 [Fusarium oxysporum f. sp. melonis 26406]|uniref:Uncharacterized protein n=1 Tax=Fusarium oxysporum f. sp. melonis 26406 TaxID=1089452 RepID=W9ZBM7_FUSOX|nr:hypothetical protein FOMG_17705 [Fusarium oxysporum f. sp. melonis 26406]
MAKLLCAVKDTSISLCRLLGAPSGELHRFYRLTVFNYLNGLCFATI